MDASIAAVAQCQHGVVSRGQALSAGMSDAAIHTRLATGRWSALHPGVYVIAGAPPTWDQRVQAALLAAGPVSVASHATAASLIGLEGLGRAGVEITVPVGHGPRVSGVVVHRTRRTLAPVVVRGFAVTPPEWTLADLAGRLSDEKLRLLVDQALRLRVTTYGACRDFVERMPGRFAPARKLARALDDLGPSAGRGESGAEDRLVAALRRDGLPAPVRSLPVYDGRRRIGTVDLGYPQASIVLEVGGDPWHTGMRRDRDAAIRNRLALDGWLWLEFTDRQVRGSCRDAVAQVRTALERRAPALLAAARR